MAGGPFTGHDDETWRGRTTATHNIKTQYKKSKAHDDVKVCKTTPKHFINSPLNLFCQCCSCVSLFIGAGSHGEEVKSAETRTEGIVKQQKWRGIEETTPQMHLPESSETFWEGYSLRLKHYRKRTLWTEGNSFQCSKKNGTFTLKHISLDICTCEKV